MTRTEVLSARGYDAETIAGNGTQVEASPVPAMEPEPHLPTPRACQGCGGPLTGPPTQRWCSNTLPQAGAPPGRGPGAEAPRPCACRPPTSGIKTS